MADNKKTPAVLLDDLAALDPTRRRTVAKELRKVAETFAEVSDGRNTAYTLRLLATDLIRIRESSNLGEVDGGLGSILA